MPLRTRTDFSVHTGSVQNVTDGYSTSVSCDNYRNVCIDDTAAGDCLSLNITKYTAMSKGLVNGVSSGPGYHIINTDRPTLQSLGSNANHLSVNGIPSDGALAAKLIGMTNPSRPVVDLPVFIGELRDFPQLFQVVGKNILQTTAKANLAYHFGWRPLMQDLLGMMNFVDVVDKRQKELKALFESGLRRTRRLDEGTATSIISNNPIYTDRGIWYVDIQRVTQQNATGHVKWKPTALPPSTNMEMRSLAIRAAYGLTIDPSTAWELIPFSWLVDWCSSVGDYLKTKRNIIGATPYDCVIMRHTVTEISCTTRSTTPSTLSFGSPPKAVRETKSRAPASPSISAYLPFLSGKQLSILGSIALLNSSERRRVYRI